MSKKVISILLLSSIITSCSPNDPNQKQNTGTIIGGLTGALVGSQFGKGDGQLVGMALGAVAGATIGNAIGANMDEQDRKYNQNAYNRALETGQAGHAVKWRNPDSGNYGYIQPTKTYYENGAPCREFTQKVTIGGKISEAYGTACRQADGSWKIIQ